MLAGEKGWLASDNCGISNAGAGLLINGEGTSCGSRFKPIAKKTTKTIKSSRGSKNFTFMQLVFLI
jgi:hypothetical protein